MTNHERNLVELVVRRAIAERHTTDDYHIEGVGTLHLCACGRADVEAEGKSDQYDDVRVMHLTQEHAKLLELFGIREDEAGGGKHAERAPMQVDERG